jgi:hypothetical protein
MVIQNPLPLGSSLPAAASLLRLHTLPNAVPMIRAPKYSRTRIA